MRYRYESDVLCFSVDISTLNGCCGIGNVTRMSVHKDSCRSKKARTTEYKRAMEYFVNEVYEDGLPYGVFLATDVTPDSKDAIGAYYDSSYEREEEVNLYNFAKANKFKMSRPAYNPNSGNDIVVFTKDISEYTVRTREEDY